VRKFYESRYAAICCVLLGMDSCYNERMCLGELLATCCGWWATIEV